MTWAETVSSMDDWYAGRPVRHRLAIAAAAIGLTVLLFDVFWLQSAQRQLQTERVRMSMSAQERDSLADQLAAIESVEAQDPDLAVRVAMEAESERIAELDRQLRERALEILAPEQMKRVLHDLLGSVSTLRLTSLETQDAMPLVLGLSDGAPNLFRHGLVLNLEGDYRSLLSAVQTLEQSDWRFYWSSLEIRASGQAPRQIRLHVYTVSLREEWVRV